MVTIPKQLPEAAAIVAVVLSVCCWSDVYFDVYACSEEIAKATARAVDIRKLVGTVDGETFWLRTNVANDTTVGINFFSRRV